MPSSLHLVFGEDAYAVSVKAKELLDTILSGVDRTFGLETIDGAAETVDAACEAIGLCIQAVQTVGFFSGDKVVWLKDATCFSDSVIGRSERVKTVVERLSGIIQAGLPSGVSLVVSAGKLDKRFAFFKTCKTKGQIYEFATSEKSWETEGQLRARIQECVTQNGLSIRRDGLERFISKSGLDGWKIASEVEKLKIYLGDRKEILAADVEAVTSSSKTSLAWDLTDAVAERKLGTSVQVLRRLLFNKESPIGLVILLQSRIRELMVFREAMDKGWMRERSGARGTTYEWGNVPPEVEKRFTEEMKKDPRSMNPYRVGIVAGQAAKFSQRELRRMHKTAVDTHHGLVSSRVPNDTQLELMLIKMLA